MVNSTFRKISSKLRKIHHIKKRYVNYILIIYKMPLSCRVQAQMQHETKLVKKFEEFDDGGREVEFFSWSSVDFLLYVEDCIVGESGEIG